MLLPSISMFSNPMPAPAGGMPTRSLGMENKPCLNPLSAGVGMPPTISDILPQMAKVLQRY